MSTEFSEERKIEVRLERAGFRVIAPRIRTEIVVRGAVRRRTEAMFPGYQLVSRVRDRVRDLLGVRGVRGLLEGAVRREEVRSIRAHLDRDGVLVVPRFEPGDKVRVRGFQELAEFVGMRSAGDCDVLLRLFGVERAVTVCAGSLLAA